MILGANSLDLDIRSWIINGGLGYDILQSEQGIVTIVGGGRYLALDAEVDLGVMGTPLVERSGSEGLFDGPN